MKRTYVVSKVVSKDDKSSLWYAHKILNIPKSLFNHYINFQGISSRIIPLPLKTNLDRF